MAKLKITRANGEVSEHKITPGVEYCFELKYGSGISKVLRDHERQTEIYFLAHECLRRANVVVPVFGIEFIETLDTVEVLDDEKKLIGRDSFLYTIASLSVETGIAPSEFIDMDSDMLRAIVQVLSDRAKEIKNASKASRARRH